MKYKLEITPAIELGTNAIVLVFSTIDEMRAASESCADLLLFLHKNGAMTDYSNMFLMYELDGDEWVEVDDQWPQEL